MSQYLMQQLLQTIKMMMDRANIGQQNITLYQTILANIENPNSDLSRHMHNYLNNQTRGMYLQGINEHDLVTVLRPWLNEALNTVAARIAPPQQQGWGGAQQQPQGYNPQGYGAYQPPYAANVTSGLYDSGTTSRPPVPPMVVQNIQKPPAGNNTPERNFSMDSFDLGRPVSITLNDADTLQHHPKEGNVVSVDNYREGSFEDMRISTIEITLNTAENNAYDAAQKALAYSPNEVIRGLFANVVSYKEIFHIPMGTSEFKRIANLIGSGFYGESKQRRPEWRNAVKVMGSLTRAEHKTFETALLKFLNPSIFKYLRTSNREVIESIEEIDDLKELDNPRSQLKVTQHAGYLNVFNEIVTRAFDLLINPDHLIESDDKNFGDFIHCDKIEFWHDDRSKYDYGTYQEKADRLKFIDSMTDRHTVLRIKKSIILTNAIDPRVASNITHFRGQDSVSISGTQNVGCKLILDLDQPKNSEIERVVCMGDNNSNSKTSHLVNLGRTLDGQLVLIR